MFTLSKIVVLTINALTVKNHHTAICNRLMCTKSDAKETKIVTTNGGNLSLPINFFKYFFIIPTIQTDNPPKFSCLKRILGKILKSLIININFESCKLLHFSKT